MDDTPRKKAPLTPEQKKLADQYVPLAQGVANRYAERFRLSNSRRADILSAVYEGLCEAARCHRDDGGASFVTYATIAAEKSIIHELIYANPLRGSKVGELSRHAQRLVDESAKIGERLDWGEAVGQAGQQSESSATAIADARRMRIGRSLPLDNHSRGVGFYQGSDYFLPLASQEPGPEETVTESNAAAQLDRHVRSLPENERRVIEGHCFEGRSESAMAREMHKNSDDIRRLQARALRRLREAFEREQALGRGR